MQEHGFIIQGEENIRSDFYYFFYHPRHNVSVAYVYFHDFDQLFIYIGSGNAYDIITSDNTSATFSLWLIGEWVTNIDVVSANAVNNFDWYIRFFSTGAGWSRYIQTDGSWENEAEIIWNTRDGILSFIREGGFFIFQYVISNDILILTRGETEYRFERRQ